MKCSVKYLRARWVWFPAAALFVCLALVAHGVGNTARPAALTSFSMPLCFEPGAGSGGGAQFIARGIECSVELSPDAAEIDLGKGSDKRAVPRLPERAHIVRLQLVGANPAAKMTGLDRMAATANYFIGNDPSQWLAGVPLFSRVQVDAVYPGVQVIYYASRSAQLEYDFLLQPGTSPRQIRFRVEGADDVQVDSGGNLELKIDGEEISQHQPVAYQDVGGSRQSVEAAYRLNADGTVGLALGQYDHSRPLVIDPVLDFLTYIGGRGFDQGWAIALQGSNIYVTGETMSKNLLTPFPHSTNLITTNSISFPVELANGMFTNRAMTNYQGGTGAFGDAFVASYSTNGSLNYLSYLGGRRDDLALAIAAAPDGSVWLTGFTDSTNFPLTNAIRTKLTGPNNNALRIFPADAFITHVSSDGTSLLFSTYFGGEEVDEGTGIALDATSATNAYDVFVTGFTASTNLISANLPFNPVNVFQPTNGGSFDAFVAEFSPSSTITNAYTNTYCTYLGGSNIEQALSIALDSNTNTWIAGITFSTNFPTANITMLSNTFYTQMTNGTANTMESNHLFGDLNSQTNSRRHDTSGISDAFVSEISPMGTNLLFSTFLGGSNDDVGIHLATDPSNNVFVTGYTLSRDFPTNVITGLVITNPPANITNNFPNFSPNAGFPFATSNFISHVFVTELSPTNGTYIIGASTTFGGNNADRGTGIGLDGNGNVYVIGSASSTNFFQTNILIFTNTPPPPERDKHNFITNYFGILTNNFTYTNLTSTNSTGRLRPFSANTNEVFIAVLSPGLTNYLQSIILGGPGDNEPNDIAVASDGSAVYFVGSTTSRTNFATINTNTVQPIFGGNNQPDAFVGKISFP